MPLTVNTNISAMNAQRAGLDANDEMATSMERLASGKRINSAVDDAAGLAISARMEAQISGLNQAVRNSNDAISLVQTAEGALQEYGEILQRIRELAIQSGGGAPSNLDRVNLHAEVAQLQEELGRIANSTRFNGEILLNGTFLSKDFQIGQSNHEEIQISVANMRPETVGAYTQNLISNVGTIDGATKTNIGSQGSSIDNGVVAQTVTVAVGTETPRTFDIAEGASARDIADALNQSGAAVNSRATTTTRIYVEDVANTGEFSFKISNSSNPDFEQDIRVTSGSASKSNALASQINTGYPNHNITATVKTDVNGDSYVELYQANGYDIIIDEYATTPGAAINLDFGGNDELVLTGASGAGKVVIGGTLIADAPSSFLLTSDDTTNSVLVGSRAQLSFQDVITDEDNSFALWDSKSFSLAINGGTAITVYTNGTYDGTNAAAGQVAAPASFSDYVTNINASIAHQLNTAGTGTAGTGGVLAAAHPAYGLNVSAVWSTGSNTLEFLVNSGVSNASSSLVLTELAGELDLSAVNFLDSEGLAQTTFSDTGGETSPTQTVRYVSQIDISTRDSALLAMTVVDAALQSVAAARGSLGAVANRLESTIQNLMTTSENTSASLSRVMDADYAAESTNLARAQVLQQASIAILAQANTTTQQVLRLLE
ncbi:flagellin [Litoricolaceae bacterium]|nr:flagellin [Litorivicinaceae bacterium]